MELKGNEKWLPSYCQVPSHYLRPIKTTAAAAIPGRVTNHRSPQSIVLSDHRHRLVVSHPHPSPRSNHPSTHHRRLSVRPTYPFAHIPSPTALSVSFCFLRARPGANTASISALDSADLFPSESSSRLSTSPHTSHSLKQQHGFSRLLQSRAPVPSAKVRLAVLSFAFFSSSRKLKRLE